MPLPPPRPPRTPGKPLEIELASKAVETAKATVAYLVAGPPIIHRHHHGTHVEVPLIYQGYVVDKALYDPCHAVFLPKGYHGESSCRADPDKIREAATRLLSEITILDAAEYREPEEAWAVPIAWRSMIIAHIRVSRSGTQIVPDYRLTQEVRRLLER